MAEKRESGTSKLSRPESAAPAEDRLNSWKEIAVYLNRDVTTAQRWEKREAMPVHRHLHDKIGSVYAFRSELDAWVGSRKPEPSPEREGGAAGAIAPEPQAHKTKRVPLVVWKFALPIAAAAALLTTGSSLWFQRTEYFWRSPIANARFQTLTSFDRMAQAVAISRDGQFVAFLSDRDGQVDVWLTQVGSGQLYNLTRGAALELVNPSVRTVGFSPDGSLVTFWVRKQDGSSRPRIGTWAVPTLGGEPKPYLEDAAEYDWSSDGLRLVYHTTAAGDPLFVSDGNRRPQDKPIFTAPSGLHAHFPRWSPDSAFIYFVEGALPDKLNVWRIRPTGGTPDHITSQPAQVSYPMLFNRRTLLYLSSDTDDSGASLYGMDVERRIPHRLTFGPEMYTSLAATADGRRLAATVAIPQRTLWRLRIGDSRTQPSAPTKIELTTDSASAPRFGPDYVVYVSSTGTSESVWKFAKGSATELWRGVNTHIIGAPAVSPDGRQIAFSALQRGQKLLRVIQVDGSNARTVADSLDLQGDPAWTPDGRSITVAANQGGVPHVFRAPLGGSPALLVRDYSLDPAWAPDGRFMIYSGPDIGTTFSVKAVTTEAKEYPLHALTLTRGARHMALLNGGRTLAVLRGEIQHKNLWLIDLLSGEERPVTKVPADFDIRDFDISPDGQDAVLERVQERSNVVLLELPQS